MDRIIFDFSISLALAQKERESLDIASLDLEELCRIGEGRIFIIFEPRREYILLETEVLDYLLQIKGVFPIIESGYHKTGAYSGDYYSNFLDFTYNPHDKHLEIYDAVRKFFRIRVDYNEFKAAYMDYFPKAVSELLLIYPELGENAAFLRECS